MIQKASEAEKKICPFIEHIVIKESIIFDNEIDNFSHTNINCLTSKCMAWVKKIEYTDIIKIQVQTTEEIAKAKKKVKITDKHICISNKSRMYDAVLTYAIPIDEEYGFCQRLVT